MINQNPDTEQITLQEHKSAKRYKKNIYIRKKYTLVWGKSKITKSTQDV